MFKVMGAFGSIKELDYTGTAEWNPHGIKPAARLTLHLPNDPLTPACRLTTLRAHSNREGQHWPFRVGDVCLVLSLGLDTPIAIVCTTSDGNEPPDCNLENDAFFVFHSHEISMKPDGLTLRTEDGKSVLLKDDYVSIGHPSGQSMVMDGDGNMRVAVSGNLETRVTGSIDVSALGNVKIAGKLGVELNSEVKISLKTLGIMSGIHTEATHPVCYFNGEKIGVSRSCEAGS